MAALVITGACVRSFATEDVLAFAVNRQPQAIIAWHGTIQWTWFSDAGGTFGFPLTPEWSSNVDPTSLVHNQPDLYLQVKYNGPYYGNRGLEVYQWTVWHSSIAIPLTLLSAYLLLWPGKRPANRPQSDQTPAEGA